MYLKCVSQKYVQDPESLSVVETMKGPSRKDEQQCVHPSRDVKLKSTKPTPASFDEAKASCKARKRKERQESISSLCQERKVIRSNSEERPTQKKHFENKTSIRRVSSSEDFKVKIGFEKDKFGL